MSTDKSLNLDDVVKDIERVAGKLGKAPWEMSRFNYFGGGGVFSVWELRKIGGFTAIIRDRYRAEEAAAQDLTIQAGLRSRNRYVSSLQRELGDQLYRADRFGDVLRAVLKDYPIKVPRGEFKRPGTKKDIHRWNIIHLSDIHFGNNIYPDEVERSEYNWQISARKLGRVADSTAHYKLDHRKECGGLLVNLCGDLFQGCIHLNDVNQDLMTYQYIGTTRSLVQFIAYQRKFYDYVKVVSSPGNHDRLVIPLKGKERSSAQKFDSYQTMMVEALQQAFFMDPGVEFDVPKTPYASFRLFGRVFWSTHSDTVVNLGSPEKGINVPALTAKINGINAGLSDADKIQVLLSGHVHTCTYIGLPNGTDSFINPALSPVDTYAQSEGYLSSRTGQWFIESTTDHQVGDQRMIWCDEAVNEPAYEQIIQPYDYTLVLRKGSTV